MLYKLKRGKRFFFPHNDAIIIIAAVSTVPIHSTFSINIIASFLYTHV